MKFLNKILFLVLAVLFAESCVDQNDTEEEQPGIEFVLPVACDTLYFGEPFRFVFNFTDNSGLGNISLDVHNNFGHHDHGDHETCNMDAIKDAVNPYIDDWLFALPSDQTTYTLDTIVEIPGCDSDSIDYDTGDYHFHIYVTDSDGYLTFTTLDVKILYR